MNVYVNGLELKVRFLCSHTNAIVCGIVTAEGYFKHNPFKIMHFFEIRLSPFGFFFVSVSFFSFHFFLSTGISNDIYAICCSL